MMIKHAMRCTFRSVLWHLTLKRSPFVNLNIWGLFRYLVPNVKKIVYSTCSIHATENERVVASALKSEEATSSSFQLGPRNVVLPTWPRRGYPADMDNPGIGLLKTQCRCL